LRLVLAAKKRPQPPPYAEYLIPISAVAFSLAISSAILCASGVHPAYLFSSLASALVDYSTIRYAIPLILCGVGLAIAYKAGVWNIGSEGQILAGAAAAAGLSLYVLPKTLPPYASIAAMYVAGFAAGAGLGLIAAWLKASYNVNEVLSTLMLNYIMMQLVNYLVYGPWRGLREYGYPRSDVFPRSTWIPQIPGTTIHYPTLALAIASAALAYLLMYRTRLGFEIRVCGANPEAARYSAISFRRVVVWVMLISGGLAGLAGVGEVAGVYRQLIRAERVSAGFGYTAIIVAWLANLNPAVVLAAGYFIGALISMSYKLQIASGISYGSINVVTGLMLATLVSLEFLTRYRPVVKLVR